MMRLADAANEARRLRRLQVNGLPRFLFVTVDRTGAVFPDGDQEAVIRVVGNPNNDLDEVGSIWTPRHVIDCDCTTCQTGE